MDHKHYQIRIYKNQFIEIFQCVISHDVGIKDSKHWMAIKYGSPGVYTVSERFIYDAYNVEILNDPIFLYSGKLSENVIIR